MNQLPYSTTTLDWPAGFCPLREKENKHNKKTNHTTNVNANLVSGSQQTTKIVCPSLGITEVPPVDDDDLILDDEYITMLLEEEIQQVKQRHSAVEQAAKMYLE